MRVTLAMCVLAAVVGCGTGAAGTAKPVPTDLKVTVWPEGRGAGASETYTLKCAPARGTVPKAASVCTRLLKLQKPFAPVARGAVCTEQYGGPQQALVTGRFKGNGVWAMFSATDGCQISRAKRIGFLLPGFSGGAPA